MSNHDIIAIGGSTGAWEALRRIFTDFPADLPAAVFVVRHIAEDSGNMLASVLDGIGPLTVKTAAAGDVIENGRAYVAPAGRHLLLEKGTIMLGNGPRENMARPAIDPLFRSAALSYGSRVIGVVLSGLLDDGAAGLAAVKRCGGTAVIQDPVDAEAAGMPLSALDTCDVDYRAPVDRLAQVLGQLAQEPAGPAIPAPGDIALEVQIAAGRPSTVDEIALTATPVALSCPACGGVLSEISDPSRLRFRCQIGHGFTAEILDKEHEAAVAQAIGVAVRALEERHTLLIKMAADARRRGRDLSAKQFEGRAAEYRQQAELLRKSSLDGIC